MHTSCLYRRGELHPWVRRSITTCGKWSERRAKRGTKGREDGRRVAKTPKSVAALLYRPRAVGLRLEELVIRILHCNMTGARV